MVDQVFIGQGIGYLGNGATNVIFPLVQIATAIALMLGEGGANLISLHLGAGEKETASKTMAAACSSLWVVGIVIAILYLIFMKPLCWMFGATELTIDYALGYGRIISFGMIFNVFTIVS
jgi:Na+-driven multidrug efflux pump